MPDITVLLPYQPGAMSTAQLAAVSYLAVRRAHSPLVRLPVEALVLLV
jgi:hypothetical protein